MCSKSWSIYKYVKKNWMGGVHVAHLVFSALSYPHVWLICQMSLDVVFCPRQPVSTYPWSDPLPFGESSLVLPRPLLQTVQRFSGISLSLSQLVRTSFSLNRRFLSLSAIAWPPIPLQWQNDSVIVESVNHFQVPFTCSSYRQEKEDIFMYVRK